MPPVGASTSSSSSLPVPGARHSFAAPSSVKDKLLPHASIFPAYVYLHGDGETLIVYFFQPITRFAIASEMCVSKVIQKTVET